MYHRIMRMLSLLLTASLLHAETPSRYLHIAPDYLATLPLSEKKDQREQETSFGYDIPSLNARELAQIAFGLLAHDEKIISAQDAESITQPEVWRNLELFANDYQRPEKTIAGSIDRTQTVMGSITLAKMLTEPTTDIPLLQERQALIRALAEDEKRCKALKSQLALFAKHESNLLALTRSNDPMRQDDVYHTWYKNNLLGSNPGMMALEKSSDDIFNIIFGVIGIGGGLIDGYRLLGNYKAKMAECKTKLQKVLRTIAPAAAIALPLLMHHLGKSRRKSLVYIKKRLRAAHVYAKTLSTLKELTDDRTFSSLRTPLADILSARTPEATQLTDALQEPSLMNDNYWLTPVAPLFKAFPLIREHLPSFLEGCSLIGMIDAFVSMAELVHEHRTLNATYCFVEYEQQDTPHIQANHFWHPTIPAHVAITNSITLGRDEHPRNVVLTGVNAGGKSTTMKAIATALILGQTFGIAPAQRFTFTPFSIINTYLNISDDIGANRSLFKAELYRARTLLDAIAELDAKKFSFTLLDEIFTGTERVEGEAGAYGVARQLATFDNSITLLATHFPHLPELALDTNSPSNQLGRYTNMKVSVDINADGSFHYPYTLLPGISDQQIALQMLSQEGFDSVITQKANEVLQYPERFTPTATDV